MVFRRAASFGIPVGCSHDLVDATTWCADWIRLVTETAQPSEKLAAVFDIDRTLISARGSRVEEVCSLLQMCSNAGIACFLITARTENGRAFAEEQLASLGIRSFDGLFMHRLGVGMCHAGKEKERAWNQIRDRHYRIVFSAGDAWHDHPNVAARHRMKAELDAHRIYLFLSDDGVAHMKLRSAE